MTDQVDRSVLPIRRPPFGGVAGNTLGDSQPDWGLIGHVKPPAGAPTVPVRSFLQSDAASRVLVSTGEPR
jgi:arylsulfatase